MRTKIKKSEYKNDNAIQPKLARRAERVFETDIKKGDTLSYVKTMDGYKLSGEVDSIDEIDRKYYGDVVEKALGIFGYGNYAKKRREKERQKEIEERQETFAL